MEQFDFATNRWTTLAPMLKERGRADACACNENVIYFLVLFFKFFCFVFLFVGCVCFLCLVIIGLIILDLRRRWFGWH